MYNVCINIGIYLKSKIFLLSCDLYNSSIIRHSVIYARIITNTCFKYFYFILFAFKNLIIFLFIFLFFILFL